MDITHILASLNDAQRQAVTTENRHVLVLAGAGSGKTRVLVHRIVWVVQMFAISPYSVLAVTFTNKAAAEMRSRIERMLSVPTAGLWVGTFHGIAHRLLRAHHEQAGLPKTFQILDSDDQLRIIKRLLKDHELDDKAWPAKQAQWFINAKKDEGLRPQNLDPQGDATEAQWIRIYELYEGICEKSGVIDFAELLLRAHELLLKNADLLAHYRRRFRHILVDEFQDTNTVQYAWLRLLADTENSLFIVGDDDQSIYGWRGAKVENIQSLQRHYPNIDLVRLEQNYRSTGNILSAANYLIEKNPGRLGKKLWTASGDGEPIKFYSAYNERDEARFLVDTLQQWVEEGHCRKACAVLYRSNAQSRVIEEALLMEGMPYRIYGGMRFFDRAEIKDALAYLRLIASQLDDAAFERVVNTPPRGIGEKTLQAIRAVALKEGLSLWDAMSIIIEFEQVPARAQKALSGFRELMQKLMASSDSLTLGELLNTVLTQAGLVAHFKKEKGEKGRARIENLQELVSAAVEFEDADDKSLLAEEDELDSLSTFLAYTALESSEAQSDPADDYVQLMTLHSAKGLEFPVVFMVGMEEGLFPGERSINDAARLAEERRLCYVGMTRAEKQLYLTAAEHRHLYGRETYPVASRFLRDIPENVMVDVRPQAMISRPANNSPCHEEAAGGFHVGQRVTHATFGDGVLVNSEGRGTHARVQVNFQDVGMKWLVVAYANLQSA
ncbi:MAG TPA: DNA helicase II [Gammaproteobacteria bacterium]|nr:DNA helicase II [Gammaproteobacteria bacterium]